MEQISELIKDEENEVIHKISKIKSNSVFITKNFSVNSDIMNENEKTCEYCKSKFYSKFNKNRHVNEIHLKSNYEKILNCDNIDINIQQNQEIHKADENKDNKEDKLNIFIGSKRYKTKSMNNSQNIEIQQKMALNNNAKYEIRDIINLEYINKNSNKDILSKENTEHFCIMPKKQKIRKNLKNTIISNFYEILKNNEYYSLGNYFIFKKMIIGSGKYGTVFFGLDFKNIKPIAIKISNCEKRNDSLKKEILIMQKLSKYKLFSKIYDEIIIGDKIYLFETLQGPNIYKMIKFCGGKFSTITSYKIGIEVLRCLKLIHTAGYLYLDLKDDNIAILPKPIMYNKVYNHIILIDYGFCEKFFKNENSAPRHHGNIRYASANALKGNPVSRKDDLISFCYFLADLCAGFLPWDNISSDSNIKEETIKIKENYPFKNLCGIGLKEILFIYNDVNCLNFCESPNYINYIYLLENYIKAKTGKASDNILFDWDEKIINLIKSYGGIENTLKYDKEIKSLFEGYPDFYLNEILEKYEAEK